MYHMREDVLSISFMKPQIKIRHKHKPRFLVGMDRKKVRKRGSGPWEERVKPGTCQVELLRHLTWVGKEGCAWGT